VAELLAAVSVGDGRALFIVGHAGLGKSTSLLEAQEAAVTAGFRVARAVGDAMESSLAFGLVQQLVEDLDGPDLLYSDQGGEARARKFFGTLRWLEGVAAAAPVFLSVDDLQWADQDSLALLAFLVRRIGRRPIAVVAGVRPWPREVYDAVLELVGGGRASIERLAPLSQSGAAQLLASRCGHPVGAAVVERSWAVTQGNPLLLEQVAIAISRGEMVPGLDGDRPAPRADSLLLARFAGLDPVVFRYAQAASVLGPRFRPELAAAVAGLDEAQERDAVGALTASGLLREVGPPSGAVEFVHPLFAQALYDALPQPVQVVSHRRAFRLLHERCLDTEAAEHAVRGEMVGESAAVELLDRVGRQARRRGALATAARLLEGAVDLSTGDGGGHLRLNLAETLLEAGRPREAIAAAASLLDGDRATVAAASQVLGNAHYVLGEHDQAARHFDRAVAEADQPEVAVGALLLYAVLLCLTDGPRPALEELRRASRLAPRVDEQLRLRIEATRGYVAILAGDPSGYPAVQAHIRTLLEDPEAAVTRTGSRDITMYGAAAKYLERFAEAEEIYRTSVAFTTPNDLPGVVAVLDTGYSETLVRTGRLAEALAVSEQACDLAEAATHVTATLATVGMAHVLLQLGRHDESDIWCDRAEKMALQGRVTWIPLLRVWDLRGQRQLRDGKPARAAELYVQAMDLAERIGLGEPCVVPWAGHAVKAQVAAGATVEAERVLAWLEAAAQRLPCQWPGMVSAIGRALLADRAGDPQRARTWFQTALARDPGTDLALDHIETLLEWGAFLRRQGQVTEARTVLADAIARAEGCGARWLADRGVEELGIAGGRRRRARRDALALTAAEVRVAILAAGGMSNREIADQLWLSVNTVETHLRHVYAKLGIGSRRELAQLADQLPRPVP
jgi:DNA-binding CsgD family transcriptional regulator/Tfp pilus assembly protein PilF